MIVAGNEEFATTRSKYFDPATDEQAFRDDYIELKRKYKIPDNDLRRAIPMEEVRNRIIDYIRKKHANK